MGRNVAIPQGDVYPNGVPLGQTNLEVQRTVHVPGTFFQKSPGFASIRTGRHRLQKQFRTGIHFVPHRFAEDVGTSERPLMVDPKEVGDIADLPGSERLDDDGKTTAQEDRILLAEDETIEVAGKSVARRHAQTQDLWGIRNVDDEFKRYGRGLVRNPVEFLSDEFGRTPLKAVVMATAIVGVVYVISRDFERSINRRKRRSTVAATAVAVPAATVETAGTTVAQAAEAVSEGAEAVAEGVEQTTETVADAAS